MVRSRLNKNGENKMKKLAAAAVAMTLSATSADARGNGNANDVGLEDAPAEETVNNNVSGDGSCDCDSPNTPVETQSSDREKTTVALTCGYDDLTLYSNGVFTAISNTPRSYYRSWEERQTIVSGVINSGPGIEPVGGKGMQANLPVLQQIFNNTPKQRLVPVRTQRQNVTVAECAMNVLGASLSEGGYDVNMTVIQTGFDGEKPLRLER